MINHEALLDGLLVVVGTAALLSALDEAIHQFLLGHVEVKHHRDALSACGQHLLQRFSLRNGAGKSVENHTFALLEAIQLGSQHIHDEVVWQQLTLVDVALGHLAQLGVVLDFSAKHVTR